MARVKTSVQARKKHKKVLKSAKGYRLGAGKLYKKAKEARLKAGAAAYAGRKQKKRDFRSLWITRISAALKPYEQNYSKFISNLKKEKVELDRKILAELAANQPQIFEKIVTSIKK